MTELVLQLHPRATDDEPCTICGEQTDSSSGPQLRLADSMDVVCRGCGKKHAPLLVALLDLAHAADRVGRIGRHTVCPPLTALLDLARAAENYTSAKPCYVRQAA